MTVRLYGRVSGNSSHARVTSGFARALRAAGILDGVVGLDQELIEGEPEPAGALAPWAIHTGALGMVGRLLRNVRHEHRVAMVAPNSDRIPQSLAAALRNHCTELIAPSDWAADVLQAEFERYEHPMHVTAVPHGIEPGFCIDHRLRDQARDRFRNGAFDVLHFSTSDRQRKGTLELIEAWRLAVSALPHAAHLWLILDPMAADALGAALVDRNESLPEHAHVVPRRDAGPAQMALMLGSGHVVCQPSRGEAFGLCPVEALACGVPICATSATGHAEHMVPTPPGAVVVPTEGGYGEIDDMEGASAPLVPPRVIASALVRAAEHWAVLDYDAAHNAEAWRAAWQWEKKLGPYLDGIKKGSS